MCMGVSFTRHFKRLRFLNFKEGVFDSGGESDTNIVQQHAVLITALHLDIRRASLRHTEEHHNDN